MSWPWPWWAWLGLAYLVTLALFGWWLARAPFDPDDPATPEEVAP